MHPTWILAGSPARSAPPVARAPTPANHQGVSDPVTGRDRRSKTDTGVAHALVSANHYPQRALSGRHRAPPLIDRHECAQMPVRRTSCSRPRPDHADLRTRSKRDRSDGLRSRVKNGVQAAAGFVPPCSVSRKASRLRTTTAHQGMQVLVRMRQEMEVERRASRRECL